MSDVKMYELVKRLYSGTLEGRISWEETGWSNRFLTTLDKYTIIIRAEDTEFYLVITDLLDNVIESVSDSDLYDVDNKSYDLMKSLYIKARRNAMGTESIIDSLIKEIGGKST